MEFFYRILHRRTQSRDNAMVRKRIEETGKKAEELSFIKGAYGIFSKETVPVEPFPDAIHVALGIVTIGSSVDEEITQSFENGHESDGVLLDAWGSALVEGAVNTVDTVIRLEAGLLNLRSGKRRSPGYHPWKLDNLNNILPILQADKLGVSLTNSNSMSPRKTVTFGIALTQ
jgi:hypothetical protein